MEALAPYGLGAAVFVLGLWAGRAWGLDVGRERLQAEKDGHALTREKLFAAAALNDSLQRSGGRR